MRVKQKRFFQCGYTCTSRKLLNTVSGTNSYVTSTGYDSAGRITSRALGNTLTQTFTYNPWTVQGGRLQNISTGTLQNLAYTYDSVGNIKTITDVKNASQKQCFQYDALDRLTNATTYGDTPQGCTTRAIASKIG
jgi:YD repeat-containing protein